MAETYKMEVSLISSGRYALFNAWLPGGQADRLPKKIEDVYAQIDEGANPIPANRRYMKLDIGGSVMEEDDVDFQTPQVQYFFR